jgi:hypothetical protein
MRSDDFFHLNFPFSRGGQIGTAVSEVTVAAARKGQ